MTIDKAMTDDDLDLARLTPGRPMEALNARGGRGQTDDAETCLVADAVRSFAPTRTASSLRRQRRVVTLSKATLVQARASRMGEVLVRTNTGPCNRSIVADDWLC